MECSEPGIIRDEELLAYLAGEEVRPAVVQHLAHCPYCSSQVAVYQHTEQILQKRLYRYDCPPSLVIGEYQLGLLDSPVAEQVASHLERCVLCAQELATLVTFLQEAPVLVEQVATSSNHHHVEYGQILLQQAVSSKVQRIIATLLPQSPRLVLVREAVQPASSWPRRYEAENVHIVLQLEEVPGQSPAFQLIGFVTLDNATLQVLQGIQVQLFSSSQVIYTQHIDDLGNFIFSPLSPSLYEMELHFPDRTVVIDQLEITDA
ncbi:MAG TPA: hypothetical protein VH593_16450 [Ktedonobacteraceae bacterium]|jgi:hypothetical protein